MGCIRNTSNIKRPGVSFDEASIDSKILVVCHCIREGESIRIIPAREADKQERKVYEGYRHA